MKYLENAGKFLTAVGGVICLVILGWGLTGCSDRPSVVKPSNEATFVADVKNVKDLCDYFAFRSVDTLALAASQGNVSLYAERPGIPEKLANNAREFYKDGLTSNVEKNRTALDQRYVLVIEQCRHAGTGWTRP